MVSADCGYTKARVLTKGEAVSADLRLGNVDSPSPLMTITPVGLAVSPKSNSGVRFWGLKILWIFLIG